MTRERKLLRRPWGERSDDATTDAAELQRDGVARLQRRNGGVVTVATVVLLLVVIAATLWQDGNPNHALANFSSTSWLWSTNRGEVARVNGATNRVDTRYPVADSRGHAVQVTQSDRYVILRDLTTGKVSVLDLATLRINATTQTTAGIGVTVALKGDSAFIIDAVQGVVSQLDPATLVHIGEPLRFPPGLAGGVFDSSGQLWLMVPSEGTVVAVKPAATGPSAKADAERRPTSRTYPVGDANHDLALTVLDSGVAVLDKTATTLTTVRGDRKKTVSVALTGPGSMPARTSGENIPVTVVDDRNVYIVNGGKVSQYTVPGDNPRLQPCVAWANRLYCPEEQTGTVYVLDLEGHLADTVRVKDANGELELEVRNTRLYINAPNGPTAWVVDEKGRAKAVDKYANNILGGDPPVNQPPPKKPAVGPPGQPSKVTASAGNATARVTWGPAAANGSPIRKYVVEGDGKTHEVGANQRSLDITGLTNGKSYTFTVYAVNGKGNGPKRAAKPVMPTSDVPDPPTTVTATANPDGTVSVSWPAANGLGHAIEKYQVTSISAGVQAPVGETSTTTLVIPAGTLTYGTQYAFTVISINDRGAGSKPSRPASNTVVPFNKPGPARNAEVRAMNRRGAVQVNWDAAADNGRPITKYVVTGASGAKTISKDVTSGNSTTLTGFGDGATVSVTIRAQNSAGLGNPVRRSGRTLATPRVTVTGVSNLGYSRFTVNVTVNDGGGYATCRIVVNGQSSGIGCGSTTLTNLRPATRYAFTVHATNPAGTASDTGAATTPVLRGTVRCDDSRGPNYSYCNQGVGVYSQPRQNDYEAVGSANSGSTYQANCKAWGSKGNQQASAVLDAYRYNNYKKSQWWVGINYGGRQRYIPFVWFNLNNGDNLNDLPTC